VLWCVTTVLWCVTAVLWCVTAVVQIAVGLMVNPPRPGDQSYPLFRREHTRVTSSLKRRARLMTDMFNSLEGVTCQDTEGE
jgi:aspartate/methionine/tyrosine aminotransferase